MAEALTIAYKAPHNLDDKASLPRGHVSR